MTNGPLPGADIKTAVIWSTLTEVKYFIIDTDWRKFQGVYINSANNLDLEKKLGSLFCEYEDNTLIEFVTLTKFTKAIRNGAHVIECGWLP